MHFDLAKRLVIPGVLGAAIGAYLLTTVEGDVIKPFVAIYLAIMGLVIIYRASANVALRRGALVADAVGAWSAGSWMRSAAAAGGRS